MSSPAFRISLRPLAVILVLASATSAALVGCSGTPEDEAPGAGTGGTTGGTATSGGTAGAAGTATGGSAGAAGAATGGAAGAAGSSAGAAGSSGSTGLPDVGCDYTVALGRSCAIAGCHRPAEVIAGDLDLTPDAGLRARLVDVPAKHSHIICDVATQTECVPAACPTNAKLLDSSNPDSGWLFAKLGITPTGCGDQMPMPPGNAADRWTEERQTCLQTFFRALAAGGPAPGTGGAGSGGSSGAATGGSAGSATAGSSASGTSSGGNGGVAGSL